MHDSHIERDLIFDNIASELTLTQSSFSVQVIEDLNIPVEFERSALPFGLLNS